MSTHSVVLSSKLFGAKRLDAEFYQSKYQENELKVTKFPTTVRLEDITTKFFKGIFDIRAEEYVAEGVPFVRINNLKDGIIEDGNIVFITHERHVKETRTALKKYDLVLSKTAYPAASLVQIEECNTSQDIIAIRTTCSEDFDVYLVVYLNTRFGLLQMDRLFQGNIQRHLSLFDAKSIKVPVPKDDFQAEVRQIFEQSIIKRNLSKALYAEAEVLLLKELNLPNLDLSSQITFLANFNGSVSAHRLDAEYFQPKYFRVLDLLKALKPRKILPLGDLLDVVTNGHTPRYHDLSVGDIHFLTAEHILDFRIDFNSDKRILTEHHENELKRTQLHNNDILITIKGRIGNAAIIEHLPGPTNINQDVALLRLKPNYHRYYIAGFLNSPLGKALIDQICTGQINPFLGLGNLRQLPIPILEDEQMNSLGRAIQESVTQAYRAKCEAKLLLETAKRHVEQMIEHG